jgi:hypothetical protein
VLNQQTNEGVTGLDQSAAPSIRKRTISRISGLQAWSRSARLGAVVATIAGFLWDSAIHAAATLAGRLRDAAVPVIGRLRDAAVPAIGRLRDAAVPVIARLHEAAAPAVGRAVRLIAWSAKRLQPLTILLRDLAGLLAEQVRPVVSKVADLVRPLVAKVVERFGMRVTVMGAATAIFIGSTGSAAMAITSLDPPSATPSSNVVASELALSSETAAAAATQIAAEQRAAAEAAAEAAAAAAAQEAAKPKPVGGLSELQMANAIAIIEAGKDEGLDQKAWAIALATAMQESKFRNYANVNVAESYKYAYQAEGSDHDSVGLFQQRPSSGWGSVKELMDPKTSASKFYDSLKRVDNWENMPVTRAAQTVQVSAFPDAYAQWEDLAWDIIAEYNGG